MGSKNINKRVMVSIAFIVILVCCVSCTTHNHTVITNPPWFDNPNPEYKDDLYFVARASSQESHEDARQQAQRSIRIQIAERIATRVKVGSEASTVMDSEAEIRNVSIRDEEYIRTKTEWIVWMMCAYPKKEYQAIMGQIDLGRELIRSWSSARSAIDREEFADAESQLLAIIDSYERAGHLPFKRDSVKLELVRLYSKQGRAMKAWQWLRDVENNTSDSDIKKQAATLVISLPKPTARDAFEGKSVALYCFTQKEGMVEQDIRLEQSFNAHFLRSGVKAAPITTVVPPVHGLQDEPWCVKAASAANTVSADAVLAVLLVIDTKKTGQMVDIPFSNAKMPALDARVTYAVIRVEDNVIITGGSTSGISDNIDALVNVIMTHRDHLPQKAIAINQALQ